MGKTITKPKTLEDQLLNVEMGKNVLVKYVDYSPEHIRRTVSKLNKKGYSFEATSSQRDSGIIVSRIR
ncbi:MULTISPECIES: hypothetical protein [Butyricimonas]|uniref:hypothetical protein n=1 Tax=Butyricimonas TaxID=574697 RepID=UPI0007FB4A14|nr:MULTISPECIES: hypothetical protein [Butyricimonas]